MYDIYLIVYMNNGTDEAISMNTKISDPELWRKADTFC